MKVGILLAGALLGTMLVALPGQARAAGAGAHGARAKAAEVKDELKELKSAVQEFRQAKEAGDRAGMKAAAAQVRKAWNELPARLKARILKHHPRLAKLIEHLE